MKKRIECVVRGRVQMVMYRDFTTRKARGLGLMGTVQNREDGTVFIVAEGEEGRLTQFIEKLKKGSVFSHVQSVTVTEGVTKGGFDSFRIIYSH